MKKIGADAFNGCASLSSDGMFGQKLESIGDRAFANCTTLKSVSFNNAMKYIGEEAFSNDTQISYVYFSNWASIHIGNYAFNNCQKMSFSSMGGVVEVGEGAFADCKSLYMISWPSTISEIPDFAFSGCSKLRNIRNIENVTRIGNGHF